MASGHPPRSGGPKPAKHSVMPTEWRIELPDSGRHLDEEFGGCRSIEAGYIRGQVLGQGTYGEVYLCTDRATGEHVAAKKIKMDNEKEGFPITAIREIKILSALARAQEQLVDKKTGKPVPLRNNIIGLREIVRSSSHKANNFKGSIYMIFDFMDHDMTGLLERSQKEGRPFTPAQVKCYLKQLFCGLWLLDLRNVLHRDLKNANLLVNNRGELKIADFGLARYYNRGGGGDGQEQQGMTTRVITLWYRPPELFLGRPIYGTEIDTWSAGCIMFELITGKPLFPGKDEADQLERIFNVMGQPSEQTMPGCTSYPNWQTAMGGGLAARFPAQCRLRAHCQARGVSDPHALDLLERLLALNPAARIKAQDAVTHQYFFSDPMPCPLADMPKFPSSHEMSMKAARHEQRRGGGARGGQPPPQPQRGQQGAHYAPGGGPPAQRQRTQGQYGGPAAPHYAQQQQQPQPPYRGGGGGGGGGAQQPYRGGGPGMGGAPAAGGMRVPGPIITPNAVLTSEQVQQLMAHGMVVPSMAGQPGAGSGYGGGHAGQPTRPPGASLAPRSAGMQPHRYGGGAQPSWDSQRR